MRSEKHPEEDCDVRDNQEDVNYWGISVLDIITQNKHLLSPVRLGSTSNVREVSTSFPNLPGSFNRIVELTDPLDNLNQLFIPYQYFLCAIPRVVRGAPRE